jgi:predicted Zn-dependent protease
MRPSKLLLASFLLLSLNACSTNPATGQRQFAGFMSPQQENSVGASEHEKIEARFGFYQDVKLQAYVNEIGQNIAAQTERHDVAYKFFILDSPIINAFALPGGYIYISRGLLALAGSEAELAAVLAHETGHITARHSAERYSHGVLTTLGSAVVSAAVDKTGVTEALSLGSNLYLSSYSRGQEAEADSLGLRYMTRGGYDPAGMAAFLASLQRETALDNRADGGNGAENFSYFSTHPATSGRVATTQAEARQYAQGGTVGRDKYLSMIDGLIYGDSAEQGFVRGQNFYHPAMGFAFTVPSGFKISNQPEQVAAVSPSGAVILFDMAANPGGLAPAAYIRQAWLKTEAAMEETSVNAMPAASAGFDGSVNGQPMTVRVMAIQWQGRVARFQIAIPKSAEAAQIEEMKRATYSFRLLSAEERAQLKPQRLHLVTAKTGDTAASLSAQQPFDALNEDRFRVLNALTGALAVRPGQRYKIVRE